MIDRDQSPEPDRHPQEVPQLEKRAPEQRESPDPGHRDDRDGTARELPGLTRDHRLNEKQRVILEVAGKFRVAEERDIAKSLYQNQHERMQQDLRSLRAQGLIEKKTLWLGESGQKRSFVALTKEGKEVAKQTSRAPSNQAMYSGFVKRKEMLHDAAIYPMYLKEARRLQCEGAVVRRIVLDFELKKKVYSPLAKARNKGEAEYRKRQQEIATEHHLKVVNGHITLPDLRIEYIDRDGRETRVDLEVASGSYHGSHAAEKAEAGFRIYAMHGTADRLAAAIEERELTAEILSL